MPVPGELATAPTENAGALAASADPAGASRTAAVTNVTSPSSAARRRPTAAPRDACARLLLRVVDPIFIVKGPLISPGRWFARPGSDVFPDVTRSTASR